MSSDTIYEIARIAIPFGAAVAGWFVASTLQDKRERRKEIRSLIEDTKTLILDSYTLTLEYYSSKNKSPVNRLSAEIKYKNMMISQYLIIINQAGLPTGGYDNVVRYTQLSTGDCFENAQFKERRNDDKWRADLTAAAQELAVHLDKRYFDAFQLSSMPPAYKDFDTEKARWPDESWF